MFMFKAREPRDAVYALLAVARDALPSAKQSVLETGVNALLMRTMFPSFLEEKPFLVDYSRPYADVCCDFVAFCIRRSYSLDQIQALDILCRPWALVPDPSPTLPRAAPKLGDERKLPQTPRKRLFYPKRQWSDEEMDRYWTNSNNDWIEVKTASKGDWDSIKDKWSRYFPKGHNPESTRGEGNDEMELPSWVAQASQAPFALYPHPGMHILKTGRTNADPLVGNPKDGHRNYSAAQTRPMGDPKEIRFRKRPHMGEKGHYSMYVRGFVLGEVDEVCDASQGGSIPKSWLELGGWKKPLEEDPPDELWRTLVADRGRDNRNPPYYYATACRESVSKGGLASGVVNTTALINNERNSIVAEFCRRVHAIIWDRCLFRTKERSLGLGSRVQRGDKVCILYGCTVPVILREYRKTKNDFAQEGFDDRVEFLKGLIRRIPEKMERKAQYRKIFDAYKDDVKTDVRNARQQINAIFEKERASKQNGEPGAKVERGNHTSPETPTSNATAKSSDTNGQRPIVEGHDTFGQSEEPREGVKATDAVDGDMPSPGVTRRKTTWQKNKVEAEIEDHLLHFRFIGESYIHGMMDGEALRTKFYNDTPDRDFELR